MWSIKHNFPFYTKEEEDISSPLSTKKSENSLSASLRMPLSIQLYVYRQRKYAHGGRGLRDPHLPRDLCPWRQHSSPTRISHVRQLPQPRDIGYCWITRHPRPRNKASHLPMLIPGTQASYTFPQLTWPSNYLSRIFANPWSEKVNKDSIKEWGVA